jgi:general secretion pathway protein A
MIWSCEYILLWKPPEFYKSKLRIGHAGAMVEWLDKHLAQVQHRPATGRKVYDTRLSEYVKEFQQSVGLNPDGIVGPMTIIYMQGMLGNDRPSLSVREVRK